MVCHYWIFNDRFKYQHSLRNGYHDLLMQCINISDIVIITVKGTDYCCIIYYTSKSNANSLLENSALDYRGYS